MKWDLLNKEELDILKSGNHILVSDPIHSGFPFDIIHFMDLSDLGYSNEEMESHWHSMLHAGTYDYTDEEVLYLFSHFCLLSSPPFVRIKEVNNG